ncbi:MAG: hypothetical protein J5764_03550, partial [Bacteroidales bacterium]|nr:hypothetical protein [Bacteroidales bacterium]
MAEGYKYTLVKLVKDWTLIIAISAGIGGYLLYHGIPVLHPAGPVLERTVKLLQPLLLFLMLFLSFCKIEPQQLRPHRWQVWLLILQVGMFGIFALTLGWALKHEGFAVAGFILRWKIVLEAIMLVLICP